MEILKYAQIATDSFNKMSKEERQSINRHFHLRPTNTGITIVSTIPFFPMRGITNIKNEKILTKKFNEIHKNLKKISSIDENKVTDILQKIGFSKRLSTNKNDLEEDIQALMIRNMSSDDNLRIKLGAKNKIQFIASELIFENGKNRVDVVGFDGIDIHFFELKKGRTTKVDQVKRYVDYYSKPKNLDTLQKLLKIYPINPVRKFESIKGTMVMQFAENSDKEQWDQLALKYSINILFFEKSLSYT